MKKLLSLFCVLSLVLINALPVFASDTSDTWQIQGARDPQTGYYRVSEHDVYSEGDVRAGEAGYVSSLYIGPNVSYSGPVRQYTNNRFKITFNNAYGMSFYYSTSLSYRVRLYRRTGLITNTLTTERYATFTSNYQNTTCYHGNQGAGKYYWDFLADYNSGISCDTVYLESY